MKHLDLHTDGSCLNNGKPSAKGGWCFIMALHGTLGEIASPFGKLRAGSQTNNRAELEAIYQALTWIDGFDDDNTLYTIYSDSQLVVDGIDGSSARNANRDMWEQVEALCEKHVGKIDIVHIDAHQSNSEIFYHVMNCRADKLARKGANSLLIAPVLIKEDDLNG